MRRPVTVPDPERILLGHGSGGRLYRDLVHDVFLAHFDNPVLARLDDAAALVSPGRIALTTDAHVVQPLVFAGGDIGRLAVAGTVNDLATAAARPLGLAAAFVIEEGFETAPMIGLFQVESGTTAWKPDVMENPASGIMPGTGIHLAVDLGRRPVDVLLLKQGLKDQEVVQTLQAYAVDVQTHSSLSDIESARGELEELVSARKQPPAAQAAVDGEAGA